MGIISLLTIYLVASNSSVLMDSSTDNHAEEKIEAIKLKLQLAITEKCRSVPSEWVMNSDAMKSATSAMSEMSDQNSGQDVAAKNIASSIKCKN